MPLPIFKHIQAENHRLRRLNEELRTLIDEVANEIDELGFPTRAEQIRRRAASQVEGE